MNENCWLFVKMFQFLGHVEVDQPKGSELVRDAIRKMKVCSRLLTGY